MFFVFAAAIVIILPLLKASNFILIESK